MLVAISLLLGQFSGTAKDLPKSYRPSYRPPILAKVEPRVSRVLLKTSVRGHKSLMTQWVIRKASTDVNAALLKDTRLGGPDKRFPSRGTRTYHLQIPDRSVSVQVVPGRMVRKTKGKSSWETSEDEDTYTTVYIGESPLPVGPLPKSWPKAGLNADKMPATFRGLGISGIPKEPVSWTSDITPVGADQYWMQWYVKGSPKKLVPAFAKQLQAMGQWQIRDVNDVVNVSCRPKSKESPFVWIDFSMFPEKFGNEEWTRISASWSDPDSIPLYRRKASGR